MNMKNMELNYEKNPVNDGFKLTSSIGEVSINGSTTETIHQYKQSNSSDASFIPTNLPSLIEPENKNDTILDFTFELNPINEEWNKRIVLRSRSLKMIYHATTINNIAYFFRSAQTVQHSKLKKAAIKTISNVKEHSLIYMKNNLQHIRKTDINIDIQPSYLLIPENGSFEENCQSICVNFGQLLIRSEMDKSKVAKNEIEEDVYYSASSDDDEDTETKDEKMIKEASYGRFSLYLKQVQITLIRSTDDIMKLKKMFVNSLSSKSDSLDEEVKNRHFILTPLDIVFNVHQCVYTDDINLPAWKVFGKLPLIDLSLTDRKIEKILRVFYSIKFPTATQPNEIGRKTQFTNELIEALLDQEDSAEAEEKDAALLLDTFVDNSSTSPVSDNESQIVNREANFQQGTLLQFSFEIKRINFTIKEKVPKFIDFISFSIGSFGMALQMKTYDTILNIYLDYVKCHYGLFNDIDGSNLYLCKFLKF
jgi:hypothetical protein